MSNTSIGPASKGSKMQMQRMTLADNQHYLNDLLGEETLDWISPCAPDYREYQLNNPDISKKLGIPKGFFKDFWPSRQSQWDGIAIGKSGILYLFEAKSHITEIQPSKPGKSEANDNLKNQSIKEMALSWFNINIDSNDYKKKWCRTFYQISNRMAFCRKMKSFVSDHSEYKDVVLIFLNFINDKTWDSEGKTVKSADIWDNHYDNNIFNEMGITREQLGKNNIRIINFDLNKLKQ